MQTIDPKYKVSVIVPAYNAEKTLGRCIASLLTQTFRNIEIILVDDGSIDKTGNICDTYQRHYGALIRVMHTNNRGVTNARLSGIKKATGRYVAFVDADDWIEDDYLSSMMSDMGTADIVAGGIFREPVYDSASGMCEYNEVSSGRYAAVDKRTELYGKMLYSGEPYEFGVLPYMCNKIFKKDMIESLMEKTDKRIYDGEDAAVVYPYLLSSKEIVITDNCKYHYVLHNDSASFRNAKDAYLNASYLYQELYCRFFYSEYSEILLPQLDQYMRRLVWKKDPAEYLKVNSFLFPYKKLEPGSMILLYGMGKMGVSFYQQIEQTQYCKIVAWADRNAGRFSEVHAVVDQILPHKIKDYFFDYIVIAIEQKMVANKVADELCAKGIERKKIIKRSQG